MRSAVLVFVLMMSALVAVARADRGGGCNQYGCWRDGGGCNQYGCWKGPTGSCNQYGCSDHGGCNQYGCWQSPHGSCNQYGCSEHGQCSQYGCPSDDDRPRRDRHRRHAALDDSALEAFAAALGRDACSLPR